MVNLSDPSLKCKKSNFWSKDKRFGENQGSVLLRGTCTSNMIAHDYLRQIYRIIPL